MAAEGHGGWNQRGEGAFVMAVAHIGFPPTTGRSARFNASLRTAVVLALVGILASPSPASATRATVSDPRHDLIRRNLFPGAEDTSRWTFDIRSMELRHRPNRNVRITIDFHELATYSWSYVVARIGEPGAPYSHFVDFSPVPGQVNKPRLSRLVSGPGSVSKEVQCNGLRFSVDPGLKRMRFTVPSRCLRSPEKVTAGVRVEMYPIHSDFAFRDEATVDTPV